MVSTHHGKTSKNRNINSRRWGFVSYVQFAFTRSESTISPFALLFWFLAEELSKCQNSFGVSLLTQTVREELLPGTRLSRLCVALQGSHLGVDASPQRVTHASLVTRLPTKGLQCCCFDVIRSRFISWLWCLSQSWSKTGEENACSMS